MMNKVEMDMYDGIINCNIATEEEINLVRCCMSGSWLEVLEAILYARTGFRTFEELEGYEEEE